MKHEFKVCFVINRYATRISKTYTWKTLVMSIVSCIKLSGLIQTIIIHSILIFSKWQTCNKLKN